MPDQPVLKKEFIQLWRTGSKKRTITSAGLSMKPLIPDGSTLTFIPQEGDRSIAVGDLALFERENVLIAHRIIGHFHQDGSLWFREKGDNKFQPGSFPADTLIGRIVTIEYDGHIRDLTCLRQRFAARMIGIYWGVLFSLLRVTVLLKHSLFRASNMPRLRSIVLKIVRLLSRVPTFLTKR